MATPSPNPLPRDRVFLSYAHLDAEWLDRLRNRLAPDIRNHRLDYFDDREIRPGEDWRPRIAAALARAGTAVLLVSPDFFASEFIMRDELPPILEAAAAGQLVVLWVPLHGEFNTAEAAALTRFQSVGDPQHPLAALPEEGRMRVLADLCREIDRLLARVPENLPFRSLGERFAGRERDLAALDQGLREHGAAAVTQPHTISGLGGIGKTRLAVEYAWRGRDRFRALLFARAGTPAELRAGLASLARGDGLLDLREQSGTEEEQHDAVVRWLQHNRGWLLILDNVDTPEGVKAVEELVARIPGGHVLITSRLTDWEGVAQRRLDLLDAEGARELLQRGSGVADAAADEVAKRLGYLPLALEQAAAYVRKQPPGFGFAGYLRLYEANERRMLETRGAESSAYPASVYLTWRATVDQLPEGARRLLRLHAWVAPTAFPVDLYIKGAETIAPGATEMDVRDWIAALVDYSMAERQPGDAISVHGLVQSVERHRDAEEGSVTAGAYRAGVPSGPARESVLPTDTYATMRALFGRHAPEPSWEPESRLLWDMLLPHAEALRGYAAGRGEAQAIGVLWKAGNAYRERGDCRSAIPPYEECLAVVERVLGAEHPDTLMSANNLAALYESQGRYVEAEPLCRRALEARERVLGGEHRDTLASLNNLAALYNSQGRYPEAEPLYRRALKALERVLGLEHPDTLGSVNNLAALYHTQGRYEEAEPLYRRALKALERVLGLEHPDTLGSVNNLAAMYDSQGRYREAEPLCRRALEANERAMGAEHPDTLRSANNLAMLYFRQRRYEEAEPLLHRRALESSERVLGTEHPFTLTVASNLALLHHMQGRYGEAELLFRRALQGGERVLGAEHPDMLTFTNNLAAFYRSQGRHEEAEPLYRRALEGAQKALGPDHPTTKTLAENHRRCLAAFNRP